jgi:hypothetical protein
MAGKRQHYVPRLLQRGFLDDPAAEAERTWLHRIASPAKCVGIKDVGVEDWFYSRKGLLGEKTLDDAITDFEGALARDVASFRDAVPGSTVEARLAAKTVTHLVIRTAHLRRGLSDGITAIMSELEALLSNPQRLGAMMGMTGPLLGPGAVDRIRSLALELEEFGFPIAFGERLISLFVREQAGRFIPQIAEALSPLVPSMLTRLGDKVRDTHNELVAKPLDDHGWVARLSIFSWSVETTSDIILPDAVALARGERGVFEPLLFSKQDDTEVVVLPVAHDRVLIGRRTPESVVDLAEFNVQAAAACEGFFIAARSFDANKLSEGIGTGPASALAEAIKGALETAEKTRVPDRSNLQKMERRTPEDQNFTFQVKLHGFGSDVRAQDYADVIATVVRDLSYEMPLHDLDGITIAADYDQALSEVDRGDPSLPPVVSGALEYGVGVAMPITVVREGNRKKHLVFAATVADGWLSKDAATQSQSLHLLIKMLAGIAHSTQYINAAFSNPDAMAREFHTAVAEAPVGYWTARQAAFVSPEQGQNYAKLTMDSLAYAKDAIEASRLCMQDSSDVYEPVSTAIVCVCAILSHAADWLGHRDGVVDGHPTGGPDLPEQLKLYGLDRWIELFGRDLAACYAEDGALDLEVIEMLGRHVERLFWCFGVYCWPEEDNVRCIVIDRPLRPPYFDPSGDDLLGKAF